MYNSRISKRKQTTQDSPFKASQYQVLQEDKKSLVSKLMYTFTFYAAKASKYSFKELNEKCFLELMHDIWEMASKNLARNSLTWKDLQNLYHSKGRKHGIQFSEFLEMLPAVSLYFDSDMGREEALRMLMHYALTLYNQVVAHEIEGRVIEYKEDIEEDTRDFLMKLTIDLFKIYKIYFPQEISNKFEKKDGEMQSFESYLNLMREFEVFPKLISASNLYFIYLETLKSPRNALLQESEYSKLVISEKGYVFTFSKFCESLLAVSRVCLPKLKEISDPEQWYHRQKDMLKILLEYMETVKCLRHKKSLFADEKFSFIVYEEYPEEATLKTFLVKDRLVREPENNMKFLDMLGRIKL